MIHKLVLALAATVVIGAASASAGEQSSKSKRGDPNKVICKTMEENGQKLRKVRVCHTAAEWTELRRQTAPRSSISRTRERPATSKPPRPTIMPGVGPLRAPRG